MLKIIIPGEPISKARPRFFSKGKIKKVYSSQKYQESKIFLLVKNQINGHKKFINAVFVRSFFYMPRPKGHYGTGKNSGKLKPSAPIHHVKTPDVDNLVKFYYDILNDLVWHDDSQVISEFSEKRYCEPGEEPRTEINIMEYGE
jgi:Holliday junction resolvase RusA-like endonuclease